MQEDTTGIFLPRTRTGRAIIVNHNKYDRNLVRQLEDELQVVHPVQYSAYKEFKHVYLTYGRHPR